MEANTYVALWFNTEVKNLQDAGHDVFWSENGWYHSKTCWKCAAPKHTLGCEINTRVGGHHKHCDCACHNKH